jgi:hypothetical protein
MANIKQLIELSDWLTFELASDRLLSPPIFKVRVKPISGLSPLDATIGPNPQDIRLSSIIIDAVLDAIVEWDLASEGVPILPTPENKRAHRNYLTQLFSEKVKDAETPYGLLGLELFTYAQSIENFLKK